MGINQTTVLRDERGYEEMGTGLGVGRSRWSGAWW